jgi:GDPmannose 4,6-dehydratase
VKTSLVIGASGQDGTFLTELLARRGDKVVCVGRSKVWSIPPESWDAVDILKPEQVLLLIQKTQPAECYYLPAFHHSAEDASLSSGDPVLFERSHAVHVRGLIHFLHAIAQSSKQTRLFYAASSHVFGSPSTQPQDESTPLNPENIYGITKTMGIHCCRHFRSELDVFAATGILFNHESPLRPAKFLSQKIVRGVVAFQKDKTKKLVLGDLSAVVDWGYAGDYAEAMTRILGHATPEDFVVATGEPHTVGEFLQIACNIAGVDWRECAVTDSSLLKKKPAILVGDSGKLRRLTGWRPQVSFPAMIGIMMKAADLDGNSSPRKT